MVSAKRLLDNHNGWSGLPLNGLLCNFHGDDDDDDDGQHLLFVAVWPTVQIISALFASI